MADLKDLVGKRILVKKVDGGDLLEAEITEVSPSGQYMRVGSGSETAWIGAEHYDVVEELAPLEPREEKPTEEEQG